MSRWTKRVAGIVAVFAGVMAVTLHGQQPPQGPTYTSAGELVRPSDFREWVFVTSGLGMNYNDPVPNAPARPQAFTNVYVNPSSYRQFMQTGKWPEQTIFILEIRSSASEGSINRGGSYQTDLRAVEAAVKDTARYPGGWAYFNFGRDGERTAPLPQTASCYTCHTQNAAVENSFVQFYPTLLDVARKMGTINATYDPNRPARHQ